VNQLLRSCQDSALCILAILHDLAHLHSVRDLLDACNHYHPRRQLNDEAHNTSLQRPPRPQSHPEEIRTRNHFSMPA